MAVERTVNIDFQTNAPRAAAEVAQVDKSLQGVAASGNQAAGQIARVSAGVSSVAGKATTIDGLGGAISRATAPLRRFLTGVNTVGRIAAGLGASATLAEGLLEGFGLRESDAARRSRKTAEEVATEARIGQQASGSTTGGIASLLREREAVLRERTISGGGFRDFLRGISGGNVSFDFMGVDAQFDEQVAKIDKQIGAIREQQERQTAIAARIARSTNEAARFRAR